MTSPRARFRRGGVALLFGCAGFLAGCGGAGKTQVRGKVTHKGKVVVSGNVTLIASDGTAFAGKIGKDGTYTVNDVPPGNVKIGVASPEPNADPAGVGRGPTRGVGVGAEKHAKGKGDAGEKPDGWFPLPAGVFDPNKSGLTGTVGDGKPLDIDIP